MGGLGGTLGLGDGGPWGGNWWINLGPHFSVGKSLRGYFLCRVAMSFLRSASMLGSMLGSLVYGPSRNLLWTEYLKLQVTIAWSGRAYKARALAVEQTNQSTVLYSIVA